jgi:predicted Fe-S protein YdhL (DUF1289 family)
MRDVNFARQTLKSSIAFNYIDRLRRDTMGLFPKIQSPCPYKENLSAVMDGDFCRMCKRNVVDLTAMDDAQRLSFLAACETDICVSYSLPIKRAAKAAALVTAAAAISSMPIAAQEAPPAHDMAAEESYEDMDIIVGGIRPDHEIAEMNTAEDAADKAMAELPVVYDDVEAVSENDETKPANTQ